MSVRTIFGAGLKIFFKCTKILHFSYTSVTKRISNPSQYVKQKRFLYYNNMLNAILEFWQVLKYNDKTL